MSTALAKAANASGLSTMTEDDLIGVLQSSLYPGASIPSIKMVLGYCKAAGLDPMQKPCHIVPMWDSKSSSMRDVVMPGIGLYRTQAARSGQYAGVTDPEFGPDVTETLGGVEITYPKWCRVVVKRLLQSGQIVEFAATEFWKENYAVKGGKEKSIAPNAMWLRRPYGQIQKCAEAQALRKAFPEFGAAPTADEMEGRELEGQQERVINATPTPTEKPTWDASKFASLVKTYGPKVTSGDKTATELIAWMEAKGTLTQEQRAEILALEPKPVSGHVMTEEEAAAIHARELAEAQQ